MNQFKDIFTGKRKPDFPRATSSQKCIRAGGKHNDLDNVGFTARHHTFFEMLGNFSFGDYFKAEAIEFGWKWVTEVLQLPKDRLYATVYLDDDEAYRLWGKIAPELKNGRVLRFGKKDNYWSMGDIGPCGPCSEIHYDRGIKYGDGPEDKVNGESDRFIEIWNLVFMQFEQTPDGRLINLPKPSVDTGAGLERIAAIMQGAESNYGIDLFQTIIKAISEITGSKYQDHVSSHHVVADHIRALTFALADGAGISNEGRGYVLRRILRRAARHGRELGAKEPFLHKLVPALVSEMGAVYPEIKQKQDYVISVIKAEEESFARTLDAGIERIYAIAALTAKKPEVGKPIVIGGPRDYSDLAIRQKAIHKELRGKVPPIPGDIAFMLYDTYGFPLDLIQIEAAKYGIEVDTDGFNKAMTAQQERSRAVDSFSALSSESSRKFIDEFEKTGIDSLPPTRFVRDHLTLKTSVLKAAALPFPEVALVLRETPFYIDAGGQIGDRGCLRGDKFEIAVSAVVNQRDHYIHMGKAMSGSEADVVAAHTVTAEVDADRRWDIMRNHTATHLAHAALRKVLGEHVKQSGSYVGPDRLRFDFSHHQPMTTDEIAEVERLVNEQILEATDVTTDLMAVDEAKASGAMALFGEKYGDTVRVVSVPGFSKELCGGTHVTNTGQIGPFFITVETGIASGVRRLEAITGREAQKQMLDRKRLVLSLSGAVNRPEADLLAGVEQLRAENSTLQKEIRKLKTELVSGAGVSIGTETKIGALSLWTHDFGETDRETMSAWIDSRKEMNLPVLALGTGMTQGKFAVMLAASASAINGSKIDAGKLLRDLLAEHGGRGGGKPNFAQGGTPSPVDQSLLIKKLTELLGK
jgi:alanyl-tRNA synthetase